MARQFAMVVLASLVIVSAGNLNAQGRGGEHGGGNFGGGGGMRAAGGGGPRGGTVAGPRAGGGNFSAPPVTAFGARPGTTFGGRAPIATTPRAGVGGFGHNNPGRPFEHRVVVSRPFFGGGFSNFGGFSTFPTYSSFSSPFLYNDPFYGIPSYASSSYVAPGYVDPGYYSSSQGYVAPQVSQSDADLSYQVERLSQEIQGLRQEQQAIAAAQLPQAPAAPPIPTVLIFKDGHRESVVNYAIVGQTVWILDENNSIKVPVSALDLDATQKENRSKGIRFLMPGK